MLRTAGGRHRPLVGDASFSLASGVVRLLSAMSRRSPRAAFWNRIFNVPTSQVDTAMLSDLTEPQRALAEFMGRLSEEAWHAGWMKGLEYELWRAVVDGPFRIGQLTLNSAHVTRLKQLSDSCGGWIVFDDSTEESFAPVGLWGSMYSAHKATSE
jgi:hypothetical protein